MKRWIWNLLISIDQLGNTICGGDPDETISSRIGKIKRNSGGVISWRNPIAKIIDWGLNRIDPGHSINSIEADEGKNALYKGEN